MAKFYPQFSFYIYDRPLAEITVNVIASVCALNLWTEF